MSRTTTIKKNENKRNIGKIYIIKRRKPNRNKYAQMKNK